jgi:ArsR family transcriptional regulator, arsenate/arsenite/antimonite-responsive transcriptional repressor
MVILGLPWKALSDDNRKETMLLFNNQEALPTQIGEHISLTLRTVSMSLRILKEADLITEVKKRKNSLGNLLKTRRGRGSND